MMYKIVTESHVGHQNTSKHVCKKYILAAQAYNVHVVPLTKDLANRFGDFLKP